MNIIDDLKLQYRAGGITQQLIFWNVGLFVVPMVVFSILSLFHIQLLPFRWDMGGNDWLSLSSNPADLVWKPWSLLSYAFLHGGFLHLLFNMMTLFFAGRIFLTFFTEKQLLGLYIMAALFAGLTYIVGSGLIPLLAGSGASKMVGASAAIMAVLIAGASYAPYYEVRVPLLGNLKLWHIAIFLVVADLIQISANNMGGHLAHLAGAAFGYFFIVLLKSGTDLSRPVTTVTDGIAGLFKTRKSTPFKKVHRNPSPVTRTMPEKTKDITQKQIDDILDKISKSGYDSLTKEEKDFLFKVGK